MLPAPMILLHRDPSNASETPFTLPTAASAYDTGVVLAEGFDLTWGRDSPHADIEPSILQFTMRDPAAVWADPELRINIGRFITALLPVGADPAAYPVLFSGRVSDMVFNSESRLLNVTCADFSADWNSRYPVWPPIAVPTQAQARITSVNQWCGYLAGYQMQSVGNFPSTQLGNAPVVARNQAQADALSFREHMQRIMDSIDGVAYLTPARPRSSGPIIIASKRRTLTGLPGISVTPEKVVMPTRFDRHTRDLKTEIGVSYWTSTTVQTTLYAALAGPFDVLGPSRLTVSSDLVSTSLGDATLWGPDDLNLAIRQRTSWPDWQIPAFTTDEHRLASDSQMQFLLNRASYEKRFSITGFPADATPLVRPEATENFRIIGTKARFTGYWSVALSLVSHQTTASAAPARVDEL